jgi:hypothetical protein
MRNPSVRHRGLTTDAVTEFPPSTGGDHAQQLVGNVGGKEGCSRSRTLVNRMKVRIPLKRGVSNELAGS